MTKYFKVWLKPARDKKIKCLYALEDGALKVTQILFDKMPYGISVVKYQEIEENQFKRAEKSRHNYKNLEVILDEKLYNRF